MLSMVRLQVMTVADKWTDFMIFCEFGLSCIYPLDL